MFRVRRQLDRPTHPRRGSMIPAVAIAIVAVAGCLALVLDRVWLNAAHFEVRTAAEAAALAAVTELVTNQHSSANDDLESRAERVRAVAARIAAENRAAGKPVVVDPAPQRDVRLGRLVENASTGWQQFLETDNEPNSVVVTAHADRAHNNSVSLFFPYLTGMPNADVLATAEATADDRVVGVRPFQQVAVPAWPLGILESHSDPRRTDTWVRQIELGEGPDEYTYDSATRTIVPGADGLPEIVLKTKPGTESSDGETPPQLNHSFIDIGSGLYEEPLARQMRDGWTANDLASLGGELRPWAAGGPLERPALFQFPRLVRDELERQIGQAKIIPLFVQNDSNVVRGVGQIWLTRLAAGRIVAVRGSDDEVEIVIQPAIVTTRTALIDGTIDPLADDVPSYIYNVQLTR